MTRLEIMVRMACTDSGWQADPETIADFADDILSEDAKRTAASQASATNPLYPPPASSGEPPPMNVGADPIIEANVRTLRERAAAGLQTYGTDLTRKDLTRDQWLEHLLHELLDAANYVTRIRMDPTP